MIKELVNINILVITDLHYVGEAKHTCNLEDRKTELALGFVQRIVHSEDIDSIDLIALLGDLVDNGKAPGAENDIDALYQELKKTGKPVIVVPGNHDTDAELLLKVFNDYEGLHEINGCQIITFADVYQKGDVSARSMEKMKEFFSKADPNKPVIVIQHSPIYPFIESPYPYNLKNTDEIMHYYTEKGVLLSVSGHAHWGIPAQIKDHVGYLTCPALCEEPFRYTIITVNGNDFDLKENALSVLTKKDKA